MPCKPISKTKLMRQLEKNMGQKTKEEIMRRTGHTKSLIGNTASRMRKKGIPVKFGKSKKLVDRHNRITLDIKNLLINDPTMPWTKIRQKIGKGVSQEFVSQIRAGLIQDGFFLIGEPGSYVRLDSRQAKLMKAQAEKEKVKAELKALQRAEAEKEKVKAGGKVLQKPSLQDRTEQLGRDSSLSIQAIYSQLKNESYFPDKKGFAEKIKIIRRNI